MLPRSSDEVDHAASPSNYSPGRPASCFLLTPGTSRWIHGHASRRSPDAVWLGLRPRPGSPSIHCGGTSGTRMQSWIIEMLRNWRSPFGWSGAKSRSAGPRNTGGRRGASCLHAREMQPAAYSSRYSLSRARPGWAGLGRHLTPLMCCLWFFGSARWVRMERRLEESLLARARCLPPSPLKRPEVSSGRIALARRRRGGGAETQSGGCH